MFGSRPDGTRLRKLSHMRKFMPFISPRRNESLVYYSTLIDVEPAFAFLEEINRERAPDQRMTLFHLYLRSLALAMHDRPGVNRFVAGGRLWQRNHVALTFSIKQQLVDGAPLLTVKRVFEAGETLDAMVESMLGRLRSRRGGEVTSSDKEVNFALEMPALVVRATMWLFHKANMMGLMPASMIDDDPLFASAFVANLGSVNLDAGYHHLWEWGTCSLFAVVGKVHEDRDGKRVVEIKYSYDERVEDGLYAGITLGEIRNRLENPRDLV